MNRETKKKKAQFLPQDLLIRVLLRLPVKSLARFRCVSKSWLSLISKPQFAKLHFEFDSTRTQRLVLFNSAASEIRSIDFNAPSLHDDSTSAVIKLNFLNPNPKHRVKIIGCCRGFILLDCFLNFYLWNPTTGVHKQLPWPLRNYDSSCPFLRGFGYDPSTDDYLVALVWYGIQNRYRVNHIDLFSLRTNTWKELEGAHFPYTICVAHFFPIAGLLFNGAIHWVANHVERNKDVIVVFDLMERSFSEIALPCDFNFDLQFSELRVFGGCLSLCAPGFRRVRSRRGVGGVWVSEEFTIAGGVWVMEEYKVQSSWTKCDIVVSSDNNGGLLYPVCCTKSGDIVGTNAGQGLVKFNDKGEVQEYRSYYDHPNGWDVVMYRESLLSLPGDS